MSWLKEALTDSARQERSLWYHGTSGRLIPSIMSQGLVPDPKERSWSDDPSASFSSPSRASIGGIYLTRNLMTARSSAQRTSKPGETSAIVVVEGQPRSFIADEDDISYTTRDAMGSDNEWLVAEAYMARELGSNKEFIDQSRQKYVERCLEHLKQRFLPNIHPGLEARLTSLFSKGWDVALDRQAAYSYRGSAYDWRRFYDRNISREKVKWINEEVKRGEASGLSWDDAYEKVMDVLVPKRPEPGEAEAQFAAYSDALTRTLKDVARPAKSKKGFNETARSLEPIGFSGANRIVAIVEYVYDRKKYGDYHDRVRVAYGSMPEDFVKQWEASVGSFVMVDDWSEPDRGMPTTPEEFEPDGKAASSSLPVKTAATQKEISDLAKRLIRGVWSQPYNTDKSQRYDADGAILIIDNESELSDMLYSLGEDVADQVKDEVRSELTRLEEGVFSRRKSRLSGDLDHIRAIIKGKKWTQAKLALFNMQPGGNGWNREVPDDETAEEMFARLYGTVKSPGYVDVEMLTGSSPYVGEDGKRYLKRLSEVRRHDQGKLDPFSNEGINSYNETNLFNHLFGHDEEFPPSRIEVYRGVPRADAALRPGDYVTNSRSYARHYMRGKMGAIIRQIVNTDDLLIMKTDDPNILEFVYYPRSAMGSKQQSAGDVKPPFTFREFWAETNGVAA